MKKLLLIYLLRLFFLFPTIHAQDSIFMKRGDVLPVKLIEIKADTIRFKKQEELTGSDYLVAVNKVKKIIYQNGQIEVFSNYRPSEEAIRFNKIPFDELKPIELKGSIPYYSNGVRLGVRDQMALFHKADSIETLNYFRKVQLEKSLALSAGLLAIPAAILCFPAGVNYGIHKGPEQFTYVVLATTIYFALEAAFVYYNIKAKKSLRKTVASYNHAITRYK